MKIVFTSDSSEFSGFSEVGIIWTEERREFVNLDDSIGGSKTAKVVEDGPSSEEEIVQDDIASTSTFE